MKLEKFSKNEKQKKIVISAIIGLILLAGGITLYRTFALYEEKKEFNVLRGRVLEFKNDIKLAIKVNDVVVNEIPAQGDYKVLVDCGNTAKGSWDNNTWGALITEIKSNNVRCNIEFRDKTLADRIEEITFDKNSLIYDGTKDNNLRYIGTNPSNYVSFNNELWRIVGVMHNVVNEDGITAAKIKLIRKDSIGLFMYDYKQNGVGSSNNDMGMKDWSDSQLMLMLNPYSRLVKNGYKINNEEYVLDTNGVAFFKVPGSYYYKKMGYSPAKATLDLFEEKSVDFSNTGLSEDARNMIDPVKWHLGNSSAVTTSEIYTKEKSGSGWYGEVGLMYASDYGFATSGGNTIDRKTCLEYTLNTWNNSEISDCYKNDWLFLGVNDVDMERVFTSGMVIKSGGSLDYNASNIRRAIRPVIYLKSNVFIESGAGTENDPFILSMK